jgi:hypothetical protein
MSTDAVKNLKITLCFTALTVVCLLALAGQVHAQADAKRKDCDKGLVVLEYPDSTTDYRDSALSFDSLFAETDHAPGFNYYREGDERLSLVHKLIKNAPDGSVIEIPKGEYTSEYFIMKNRRNLTLKAKPGTVWLISDNSVSTILCLVDCAGIKLQGIGFLHRTGGFCTGNSIEIHGCKNIVLDSCDISGSGTIGVVADLVDGLTICDCYIHDCTYQMMSLYNVRNITLFNNLFTDNRENTTITEGVSLGNIWGKCIIQNNTFYQNTCAALVFDILRQEGRQSPVGDGHIYVRRNLFYDNYSYEKSASIFDVFCDETWGEYTVPSKGVVSFKENVFNTFSDAPLDDESENLSDERYIYPEMIVGDFGLDGNFFEDIKGRGYSIAKDSFRIGIFPSKISWLARSRNPRLIE